MRTVTSSTSPFQKQRLRDQIRSEIEDYIRRGGEIRVLDGAGKRDTARRASVWHQQEEVQRLID